MLLERYQPFVFREVAAFVGRPPHQQVHRKTFIDADGGAALTRWRRRFANADVFVGMHAAAEPRVGAPGVCPLVIDVDAKDDPPAARRQALFVADRLREGFGLEPAQLDLYYSGGGYHAALPLATFDEPRDPRVLRVWAILARALIDRGCDHVDGGIYDRGRLIRASNSINGKTGRYKVPLEYAELRDYSHDEIQDLARAPRDFETAAFAEMSPKATGWLGDKLASLPRSPDRRARRRPAAHGWRVPPCVRRIERATLRDGERHAIYFTLARCYASIGMDAEEAVERLREIDARHPIADPDYIERTVHNAWANPGIWGCPNPTLERFCEPRGCHLPRRKVADGQAAHPKPANHPHS